MRKLSGNRDLSDLAHVLCRPWTALLWLALTLACGLTIAISLLRGYSFDTSILALLPDSESREGALDTELASHINAHLADLAGQRMVFLVSHGERRESAVAARQFSDTLERSELFANVQAAVDNQQAADWRAAFRPYRYNLMTPQARASLEHPPAGEGHPILDRALARLYSPMASTVAPTLVDDPLQLFFSWQLQSIPKTPFSVEDGWLTRAEDGRTYRLITVTLAGDPYQLDYQQQVVEALDRAKAGLPAGAEVLSSGVLIHAAHGAAQARTEISTIGVGSVVGISLLLLYCFRRGRYLAVAFLPIASGWVFALAIGLVLFERLHLVTLAFGASLIGVAMDYSLHYLCAREEPGHLESSGPERSRAVLAGIMPGITLGLISSALAYAAQGAAPFPGLRQMAVFSVSGLLGAWLTVVLWLPYVTINRTPGSLPIRSIAARFRGLLLRWPNVASRPVAAVMAVLVLVCGFQLTQLEFDDDLRRLQTSPPSLLAEDRKVQALTSAVNPSQYFVVSAENPQALLKVEEKLQGKLNHLVDRKQLADFQSVSRWVPSLARQQENRRLNENRVFAEDGLAAQLAAAIGSPELGASMAARFEENAGEYLTVDTWLDGAGSDHPNLEWVRQLWLGEFDGEIHSLVMLSGIRDAETLQQLTGFANIDPRIQFVDKLASITEVLEQHRGQLQQWIAIAYAVVFLVLTWRYRWSAWRILAAPALATLISLAALSAGGLTVNIFNLLAFLLVLGIGLDAGIFLRESARREYTWVAVTLAACTTALAFGLLALSETPVLRQFGTTVLLGIIGVWGLAPCFLWGERSGLSSSDRRRGIWKSDSIGQSL